MPNVENYNPGTFCWIDLQTTDIDAAKTFYSDLLNWKLEDTPAGDMTYTMARINGRDVCGMSAQMENMKGAPPVWTNYIAVKSANEIAEKAKNLGGTIVAEPFDVMDVGRMAVITDPTGATFGVWEAKKHFGSGIINEPGAVCWNELITKDIGKAGEFYSSLFGWKTKESTGYVEFLNGDKTVGGMLQLTDEMGPVPPHWGVYFAVENVDRTAERVKALGGKEYKGPTDIPEVGRFAVFADPQGGGFAVIKMAHDAK